MTALFDGHRQRKAASLHNCLVSGAVGGVSSRLEDEESSSRKPKELAM